MPLVRETKEIHPLLRLNHRAANTRTRGSYRVRGFCENTGWLAPCALFASRRAREDSSRLHRWRQSQSLNLLLTKEMECGPAVLSQHQDIYEDGNKLVHRDISASAQLTIQVNVARQHSAQIRNSSWPGDICNRDWLVKVELDSCQAIPSPHISARRAKFR